ncbi:M20 family metallo-hydrolase [Candidatus Halobonum tyrrellensis]|uniref:Hydantoinase/carbamoylase family amidase n=1 Tax=Candidatus Halobonum tyrrellensis G22 TaxID=1324957 RepID=V4IVH6_9EURY|nr:M20 family metallo-hydrolase [Candidatus Halobonum tyrrellensis]ESP87207.1 hydantoinase/carbamoylase family amidase [Candidatus Halobonum tyrrellensis G22]
MELDRTPDTDRLREDIEANAAFGDVDAADGRGRTVLTGTDADRKARERFVDRLADAGLDVTVDAVGNVAGTWAPPSADPDAAPVAAGSHLDSVPEGGIFDGPLGVYAALEAVRTLQEAGVEPTRPVVVVSFTEEEGQRYPGLLGSSVAAGERSVEAALEIEDDDGVTLAQALESIGFRGEGRLDASEWDAWYELHVEQDSRLETAGVPVGVVTTITGITHCEVTIEGEANHAGATPMGERTDALAAAAEFVLDVEAAAEDVVGTTSESAVGTVGSLSVSPNATNVVPGRVEASVDVRDVAYESMETIVTAARSSLSLLERERGVDTAFARPFDLRPTPMSERLRTTAHDAGDAAGVETLDLHSGAAHDTMHVAGVTDAALLFAPSRDGVSHNPREWTDWEDCATATRVLAGALAAAATE